MMSSVNMLNSFLLSADFFSAIYRCVIRSQQPRGVFLSTGAVRPPMLSDQRK
jgi:hypothetical protein